MKLMVVVLAVLAMSAQAVNLEHRAQAVRGSSFGQDVLAELQSKMDAGAPIEELISIIDEIATRLSEAQTADDAQNAAHREQCKTDIEAQQAEIERINGTVNDLKAAIATKKSNIAAKKGEIAGLEEDIKNDKADIAATIERITAANNTRKEAIATYNKRTNDTALCLEAIDDILDLDLETLAAGQDNTKADFEQHDFESAAMLEKLASKVEGNAKSLVQIAQVSAATLGGDVDDLKQMLVDLKEKLGEYQVELDEGEKQNKADYEALLAAEQAELAKNRASLAEHQSQLATAEGELAAMEEALKQLETNLKAAEAALDAALATKAATEKRCADLNDAYAARTAERKEEDETLVAIKKIIEDKLSKSASHVLDRVDEVTVEEPAASPEAAAER